MRGKHLFSGKDGLFSKKEITKRKLEEKRKLREKQKLLRAKFLQEEKKRKLVNKIRKEHTKDIKKIQKEELKKIKLKENKRKEQKEIKKILTKKTTIRKPTLQELEKHLIKLSEEYDHGIHKSKKLHDELIYLGLTESGLKEFHGESEKKRNRRIEKINKVHKSLINILETNKDLEQRIEILDEQIKKEMFS